HLNPGIEKISTSTCLGDLIDFDKIADFFLSSSVDCVVVGPEAPLILGICDRLRSAGINVVGPTKSQARLEGDKIFMRALLLRHIKGASPQWSEVHDPVEAADFISKVGQAVVKPVGLTGGKGVRVMGVHFASAKEAIAEVESLLKRDEKVLLEERLVGEEFSRMAFVSGGRIAPMPIAQDFKYAFDDDKGGMTGGMGAYTMSDGSMPFLNEDDLKHADQILQTSIDSLRIETGEEYRGFLYGQFMATADGIRVIEFNVRLGDPEAINMMGLINGDVAGLLNSIAVGDLNLGDVSFSPFASLSKYLVPSAYPNEGEKVDFFLPEKEIEQAGFSMICASIAKQGQGYQTLGSRALAIYGAGEDLFDLTRRMESLLLRIEPPVLRHRKDIGDEKVIRKKIERMKLIRNEAAE
ncbi:MAG: phosphoribosylamine--glycine ligase, partial [Chloroflexi bacterium]|nr:phosphoribosylamine--glycine ligase [Chloroflexota bacterium]